MTLKGGYWREAASLILVAKDESRLTTSSGKQQSDACDFSVLMLKRSRKSSFLSEKLVFPGGTLDDEDFHESWKSVLESGTEPFSELESDFRVSGERPALFSRSRGSGRHLSAELASRIAAIRETFEETGILLVRPKAAQLPAGGAATKKTAGIPTRLHLVPKSAALGRWRERVRKDAGNFRRLCEELRVMPNVWALKEWSNWLTPTTKTEEKPPEKPRRFDTIFFICCLDGIVKVSADRKEVYSPRWSPPAELLRLSKQRTPDAISLVDPQIFELSRLREFRSLKDLCIFAAQRQDRGVHRTRNTMIVCLDGYVSSITGDDTSPTDMDPVKPSVVSTDKTIREVQAESKHLNRIEWPNVTGDGDGQPVYRLVSNVALDGHVIPRQDDGRQTTPTASASSNL